MDEKPEYSYILNLIAQCNDAEKLTRFAVNAKRKNADEVYNAAFTRLKSLLPLSNKITFETKFWKMFSAYEDALIQYEKPTTRLNESRRIAQTEGPEMALADWILQKSQNWGFEHLIALGHTHLTAEALLLEHAEQFDKKAVATAKSRMDLSLRPQKAVA